VAHKQREVLRVLLLMENLKHTPNLFVGARHASPLHTANSIWFIHKQTTIVHTFAHEKVVKAGAASGAFMPVPLVS
jgi:hypothetical protein